MKTAYRTKAAAHLAPPHLAVVGQPALATTITSGQGATPVAAAPPATVPLFGVGLGVIGLFGWRRSRESEARACHLWTPLQHDLLTQLEDEHRRTRNVKAQVP